MYSRDYSSSTPPRSLLLVDDDPGVRDVLGGQLEVEGYVVATCCDALQALEMLRGQRFAVIISDQQMPAMTGLEFLGRVRDIQPHASRILITGVLSLPTLVKAINEGEIYRFVAKPWGHSDLLATVKNAFQRHDLLEANEQIRTDTIRLNQELSERLAAVRAQSEQLAKAHQALADHFNRSLDLCHRLVSTLSNGSEEEFASSDADSASHGIGT
jgi:DNA-binding NtrC family response regulator